MTFDEQHGWIERGTPGFHSGAVVRDVDLELSLLRCFATRAKLSEGYWMTSFDALGGLQRAERLAEQERHHRALADVDMGYALEAIREGDAAGARHYAKKCLERKLAMHAPWIVVLYAGDLKRAVRGLDHDIEPYTPNPYTPWGAHHGV
jgi:hypothetical protein